MSGDSIAHGTKFGAYEALFQQLEGVSLGNQPVDSETGESAGEPAGDANALWHGLVFKLEGSNLVIPCAGAATTGDVEVASCGEVSPLPLVKSWIVGMTHIRGEIYTVMDFSDFLGKKRSLWLPVAT